MLKEGQHWATSYALKADELYTSFPTKKYMSMKAKELPSRFNGDFKVMYGEMFRYFMYLLIKDVIENQVTFKFPPTGDGSSWIEMTPISGDDFIKARQNGAFQDVDFLVSDFTGYQLTYRKSNRYGSWRKRIFVSSKYRDRITELTNKGVGW